MVRNGARFKFMAEVRATGRVPTHVGTPPSQGDLVARGDEKKIMVVVH